jgi:secreted trypsin-like serine protease
VNRLGLSLLTLILFLAEAPSAWPQSAQYDPGTGRWLVPTIVRRHDVPDSTYLSGAAAFPAVGGISSTEGSCSCTLIAPNWILVAAHCVDNNALAPSAYTITLGGVTRTGAQKVLHPGWTGGLAAGTDIALVRLNASITTVAPMPINDRFDDVGRMGTHVGRGRTGTGLTGHTTSDGLFRAGTNMQDVTGAIFGWSSAILLADFDNPNDPADNWFGSATPTALEAGLAPGDSGGALFIDFGFGPTLAGVHSFITSQDGNTNMDYGDASGSTRVASHFSWIVSVTGIPEPSTLLLLFLGAPALAYRRWRAALVTPAEGEE